MGKRSISMGVLVLLVSVAVRAEEPQLSDERVVFQTKYGDVEFGFYQDVRLMRGRSLQL
jgi:hypothetical protein